MKKSTLYTIATSLSAVTALYLFCDVAAKATGWFRFADIEPSWLTASPRAHVMVGAVIALYAAAGLYFIAQGARDREANADRDAQVAIYWQNAFAAILGVRKKDLHGRYPNVSEGRITIEGLPAKVRLRIAEDLDGIMERTAAVAPSWVISGTEFDAITLSPIETYAAEKARRVAKVAGVDAMIASGGLVAGFEGLESGMIRWRISPTATGRIKSRLRALVAENAVTLVTYDKKSRRAVVAPLSKVASATDEVESNPAPEPVTA